MADAPQMVARPLRSARVAVSVAFGLQGFVLASLLTELPDQVDRLSLAPSLTVAAVFVVSLCAALGSVLAEFTAVRLGSRAVLRIAVAGIAACAAFIGVSPSPPVFYLGFVVYGIFLGMVDAAGNMQAIVLQRAYGRSIIPSFHAFWSLGTLLGAVWVSVAHLIGWGQGPTLVTTGVVGLIVGARTGRRYVPRSAGSERAAPDTTSAAVGHPPIPTGPFLLVGGVLAIFYVVDLAMSTWSTTYLQDEFAPPAGVASLGLAFYQATALVSRGCGDLVVRRIGTRRTVLGASAIGLIGLLIVIASPTVVGVLIGCAITGVGLPVLAPLCFAAAGNLAPPDRLDVVIARINLFNYAGTVVGGAVVGAIAVGTSTWRAGFVLPAVLVVLIAAAARRFPVGASTRHTRA